MTDRSGQQLGNYRLIRLIGQGGFAEVYLGEHIYLQTNAAIKVMNTQVAQDELQGVLNEARTIARLVHPHIVRVLEFGVEGATPFLVMDFAANGSLRQRHPKGTRLPLSTIIFYVKQVAEGLQYAHNEKLIHRDIKPENMLIGRRDEILLSDFGIALVAQSSRYQNTQEVIGTASYMAPEQIQGKPRPASDQYSLGIVVYEWLAGNRPFHGSFTEIALQHVMAPPPPLREIVPGISPAVEEVVLTALAKDPHHRFMSIHAFANALELSSRPELYVPTAIVQSAPPTMPYSPTASDQPSTPNPTIPTPYPPQPSPVLPKRGLSRRAMLLSLAGVALGGGAITWLALSLNQPRPSNPTGVSGNTGTSTVTHSGTSVTNAGTVVSTVPITVASKLDLDGHLLGQMYVLLLQKAGYTVTSKLAAGDNATLFAAIKSGSIDLYPEFTGTGLSLLGIQSSFNPDMDYQTVKNAYEQQFHITWLDQAPLNDGYALCTSQARSQSLGVNTLSQLAPQVAQLTLAAQSDGIIFINYLKATYGFDTTSFKVVKKVDYAIGFAAVKNGQADVTEGYTTDGSVTTQGFVFLTDDKHGFPEFHPAPIVRDSVLQRDPGIAAALNPIAPLMTTEVNVMLQQQVSAKHNSGESIAQAVQEVATAWLMSVHLL